MIHGQLPRNLDEEVVDIEQSYQWIKSGDIKEEQRVQQWQLKTKQ
jgi:hypothetical protein